MRITRFIYYIKAHISAFYILEKSCIILVIPERKLNVPTHLNKVQFVWRVPIIFLSFSAFFFFLSLSLFFFPFFHRLVIIVRLRMLSRNYTNGDIDDLRFFAKI